MGADFKEKAGKSFEKCWDKAAVEANTPDLFRKSAEHAANRFEAEPIGGCLLSIGDSTVVRVEGRRIVGRNGLSPVLVISAPTAALSQSIAEGCDVARADVVSVDPISGIYEVTIH